MLIVTLKPRNAFILDNMKRMTTIKERFLGLTLVTGMGLGGLGLSAEEPKPKAGDAPAMNESRFLENIRQLTFEGKRSGEGYFSADGKWMVFQSEREKSNPFYQIYLMNLETGDQEQISPGTGKTTCAWIHPDGDRILFASTHLDAESKAKQEAEIKERESNRVRRYSWDYDEQYDLFSFSRKTKELKQLSKEKGYDAEGAYSPDGNWIVFASNREAYSRELTKGEQERLKVDKQYFMDLYLMKADGSEVKRLTDQPGYDGGPFFSTDGKKICWRRFNEKGDQAEVYTMNVDGSDQKPLTKLGAMSWAPYFHPSGKYVIFTTNLQGFANFELYIVDAEGKKEPVRVTTTDGFDGLPVFSPDGQSLSWTSGRTPDQKSQIFMASWSHESALKALDLAKDSETSKVNEKGKSEKALAKPQNYPDLRQTQVEIAPEDLKLHVNYLASEPLGGRMTGTEGEILATEYMADVFKKNGLKPFGAKEGWYDPFEFTAGVDLGEGNKLTLKGKDGVVKELEVNRDWRPLSFSEVGEVNLLEIVFAGYGIETPDGAKNSSGKTMDVYSSYAHLDVKDKWVMVFRYLPDNVSQERRDELAPFSSLRHKALMARQKGAKGIMFVSGPNSKVNEQLVPLGFDASLSNSGIVALSITDKFASDLLKLAGKDLKALQDQLDKGDLMGGIHIPDQKLAATIKIKQEKKMGRNVLAVLPKDEEPDFHTPPLIIGAHIDHLGMGGTSSSRASGKSGAKIHFGADDNASGVAGLLEIAQWMAQKKATGELKLKRDVIFAGWSGEELGLLGSNHFVESLAKMIRGDANAKLTGMISAYLNMDMIGRFNKNLVLQAVGSSSVWSKEIEKRNVPIGLPIITQQDAHLATDSTVFYLRGIPTLSAFTGAHEDYHTPKDTADKINYERASQIARLVGLISQSLATSYEVPDFIAMEAPKNQGTRSGMRVYLGTIPDYAQGDIKGVKLSGVSPVGPAAKAGVQSGDIIVKLGSKDILNIYDYTYVMGELKVGVEIDMEVKRGDKIVKLKVIPGSRD